MNTNTQAVAAYDQAKTKADRLLVAITEKLNNHKPSDGLHWGHVGDVAHVWNQLEQIAEFLQIKL